MKFHRFIVQCAPCLSLLTFADQFNLWLEQRTPALQRALAKHIRLELVSFCITLSKQLVLCLFAEPRAVLLQTHDERISLWTIITNDWSAGRTKSQNPDNWLQDSLQVSGAGIHGTRYGLYQDVLCQMCIFFQQTSVLTGLEETFQVSILLDYAGYKCFFWLFFMAVDI